MWKYVGTHRPEFADTPGAGQESVWDYPRPPVIVPCKRLVEIYDDKDRIAVSSACVRVLETASPPTFYLPTVDVAMDALSPAAGASFCEWKGAARYYALTAAPELAVAWGYPEPTLAFRGLRNHVAFYPARVACVVDGERVRPQPGGFYGGWVTNDIVGPCKGEPGTSHW